MTSLHTRPSMQLFVWAVVTACTPSAGPETTPRTPPVEAPAEQAPPNLLLITLDTLRRDAVSVYGAGTDATPILDRVAREGLVFEDAYTTAPITLPAHTSLMTGLYPASHGVRDNATGKVPSAADTLAEALKARGYETHAHVAAYVLHPSYQLDQGFDTYEAPGRDQRDSTFLVAERRADAVAAEVIGALPRWKAPYFSWVHLFDPHFPYDAPGATATDTRSAYAAEVRYADAAVGRVLEALSKRGDLDNTYVVITADHGESLGDAREPSHGYFVYDPTMRIPMILRGPEVAPGRFDAPVSLVDLAPTLFPLLTGDAWPHPADGLDLRPALRDPQTLPPRTLAMETYYPYVQHGWAPLEAVVDDGWKLIHSRKNALYDREQGELDSLWDAQPAEVTRLSAALEQHFGSPSNRLPSEARSSTAEERAMLTSLGYVDASPATDRAIRPDMSELDDMHDQLATAVGIEEVFRAEVEARFVDALDTLRDLTRQAPDSAYLHRVLGSMLLRHAPGALDETEEVLKRAATLEPHDATTQYNLAVVSIRRGAALQQAGQPDEARGYFLRAEPLLRLSLEGDPDRSEATSNLAQVLAQRGEHAMSQGKHREAVAAFEESYALLERVLEAMPRDAPGRAGQERIHGTLKKLIQHNQAKLTTP